MSSSVLLSSRTVWATRSRSTPSTSPIVFFIFDTILHRDVERIAEDIGGLLEGDTVLALVGAFFRSSHLNRICVTG